MDVSKREGYQRAGLFLGKLRGGSQAIMVMGTNGRLYVVKFLENPQGPNVLFNEVVGAELFQACGLAVARWQPLLITDEFLDTNKGCWIETEAGLRRPRSGLCFASRYVASSKRRVLEILPGSYYQRIVNRSSFWLAWYLDACCEHADHRQAIFQEDRHKRLKAFFIDSGHLLGGPEGNEHPHSRSSRYLDPRVYSELNSRLISTSRRVAPSLDLDMVRANILRMPEEWQSLSAERALNRGLDRLASWDRAKAFWGELTDTIVQRNEIDCEASRTHDRSAWRTLLRPAVPSSCRVRK